MFSYTTKLIMAKIMVVPELRWWSEIQELAAVPELGWWSGMPEVVVVLELVNNVRVGYLVGPMTIETG